MQRETLQPLLDLPPVVENSLFHAIATERQDITVAYHVAEPFEDNTVRILNMSTADYRCAAVRFVLACAIHVDDWNGDKELGHPLCELGVKRNSFYEVQNSQWVQYLEKSFLAGSKGPTLKHYAMAFRARIVQIAAHSYRVNIARQSLSEALL